MDVKFDFSDLNALAADLLDAADNAGPFVRKAVEVSARNVKDSARSKVQGRKYFGSAASAIDYELKGFQGFGATVIDAEIGYDKSRGPGMLGNLVEFGAPNAPRMMNVKDKAGKWITVPVPGGGKRPLPPGGELQKALQETDTDFVRGIDKAIADALRASNL